MTPPILELVAASKTFRIRNIFGGEKSVAALQQVSLKLDEGRALAIVGESGSGKSTLGRAATGLFPLSSGQVLFRGRDIATIRGRKARLKHRRAVQMIFQDPFSALNPAHTVRHHLERPLRLHHGLSGVALGERVAGIVAEAELDPDHTLDKYPHELSGGQRQRVNLARVLAVGAELVVADEPTSMLDVSIRRSMLELIARLKTQRGLSLLYITHDIATAHYIAEETAVMFGGRIVEWGPSREVIARPVHPYTRVLLSAVPNASERLDGDSAAAAAFAVEVARVRGMARAEVGQWTEVSPGHYAAV
ncbi:dipeptide/oligopeptide/nickel ABC transporter ATP-binding protein [Devosia sp. Root413D1]|uniref:ABC transporter ATP-binding protein n=1 Tax=Devosia sp. Root413D1 TaxID=1736531 RepID=UPI0006F48300|nr:ATP-binding cassette domain-containing protein [Devosia sp. Root413D1]KQW79231.1 dipeptide/oligopeptide/nickel ABC transporter ATP-binding protein [Devosia sp. Root413D1]